MSITKVFGLAITKTVTVEAENQSVAVDNTKNLDWLPVYKSITPSNLSDAYEIAEITVDGKVMEDTFFSNHLLREAIELNKETYNGQYWIHYHPRGLCATKGQGMGGGKILPYHYEVKVDTDGTTHINLEIYKVQYFKNSETNDHETKALS